MYIHHLIHSLKVKSVINFSLVSRVASAHIQLYTFDCGQYFGLNILSRRGQATEKGLLGNKTIPGSKTCH